MATARKTTKKSPEGAHGSETMTELFTQMMDPKHVMRLQREATAAAFDGALELHAQTRKMAEQAWNHSYGDLDAHVEPWREAGKEMQAASFDLGQKALETGRSEMNRWFGMFNTAS